MAFDYSGLRWVSSLKRSTQNLQLTRSLAAYPSFDLNPHTIRLAVHGDPIFSRNFGNPLALCSAAISLLLETGTSCHDQSATGT
jgi:hypothetical protein